MLLHLYKQLYTDVWKAVSFQKKSLTGELQNQPLAFICSAVAEQNDTVQYKSKIAIQ